MPSNFKPAVPANPYVDYTSEDLYVFLAVVELGTDPGETYLYSNVGFAVLGHLLEQVSGKTYETLLRERLAKPLGLKSTGIALTPEMKAALAPPYHSPTEAAENWDLPTFAGAGGIRSDVRDCMLYLKANMGLHGDERMQRIMAQSHLPRFKQDEQTSIGLGWHILTLEELDEPILWHNGQTGGYHSYTGFMKEKKVGVVMLTNTAFGSDGAAFRVLKLLAERAE